MRREGLTPVMPETIRHGTFSRVTAAKFRRARTHAILAFAHDIR
jgi:hypothetical protein